MSRHIVFCLCPGLPLFCLASALEVLRHANRFAGEKTYRWTLLCENDRPVQDGNGIWWNPGTSIDEADPADVAFIVAGFDAGHLDLPQIGTWLGSQARAGRSIGGLSNGAFILAQQGLLDEHAATTHWEDFESFYLNFPRVRARYQRFVVDRRRLTCSGGSATLDLFIEILRQDLGNELALRVSRQMLLQEAPDVLPGIPTRRQLGQRVSPLVQDALGLIDSGFGESLGVEELAQRVGLSRRELLRRFRGELNTTPSAILAQRRLERARSLILNSRLPMAAIASAVGFSSQAHLTSSYRRHFGITPAQQRREYLRARERLPLRERELRDW